MTWVALREQRLTILKWIGTATGIIGAFIVALNIDAVGIGFVFFAVSSATWTYAGWMHREMSLFVLQVVFLGIDLMGIYNWLIV
jgi:hypothetical protein